MFTLAYSYSIVGSAITFAATEGDRAVPASPIAFISLPQIQKTLVKASVRGSVSFYTAIACFFTSRVNS
ncbi:MAG: hypothetical protein QNJ34_18240 [Xenococcaceae cyanobacterium MO_188.B29]|nr:hypothetical protein [Xenococcaceae cyanobacterium MO_188.B29]